MFRERLPTGWANFCSTHYHEWLERERLDRWRTAGSPGAAQSMAKIRALAAANRPSAREHWHIVMAREGLSKLSYQCAEEALLKLSGSRSREPGEDDEALPLGIGRDKLEEAFRNERGA